MSVVSSVIVSTYNGERYIVEQLESIRNQTRSVDEVIIKDDCSSDDTCEIIKRYIYEHELINWKLIENDNNLGWKKNFVSGIKLTQGEFIFFCDQDDIWDEFKVEKMITAMKNNSQIDVLVSNYEVLNCDNVKSYVEEKKVSETEVGTVEEYKYKKNLLDVKYPGCVYCIRKRMIDYYDIYWDEEIAHDAFVWHLALFRKGLYVINNKLIKYRRHSNTVTGRSIEQKNERIERINRYEKMITIYMKYINEDLKKTQFLYELERVKKWNKNRLDIIKRKNLYSMLKNLAYLNYYWSPKTYISDILISLKKG